MSVRPEAPVEVALRRATTEDVPFLVELVNHEDVAPYLAAGRERDHASTLALVERSLREPERHGVLVVEVDGAPAGTVAYEVVNRRSSIADLSGLAVHPRVRGHGVALRAARLLQRHLFEDHGLHRLQLEVYGGNDRALRHAERAGFTREGVRRSAYRRGDGWVDGVLFGLVREDWRADPD